MGKINIEFEEGGQLYNSEARLFETWEGGVAFNFYPIKGNKIKCRIEGESIIADDKPIGHIEIRNGRQWAIIKVD